MNYKYIEFDLKGLTCIFKQHKPDMAYLWEEWGKNYPPLAFFIVDIM